MPNLKGVWIGVHPDAAMFGIEARKAIKAQTAGMRVDVPVDANIKPAVASVEALKARMRALNDKLAALRITATDKQAEATIAKVQAKLATLAKTVGNVTMSADTTKLDAQVDAETARLKALQQQAGDIKIDADTKAALAKISGLELAGSRLEKRLKTIKGDLNVKAARDKLAAIQAQITHLKSDAETIRVSAETEAFNSAITVSEARIEMLQKQAADIRLGGNIDTTALLSAEASLLGLEAAFGKATDESAVAKTAMNAFFASSGRGSTFAAAGWKLLTGHITLFGGALNRVLPKMFTSVAVWHLLADAVIELVAVWAPAIIAVTAFGVAGADAAKSIYNRMVAVHTVMDATGQAVPPLTNSFGKLAASVKPEVYQLFGDALVVMGKRGGAFNAVATQTGRVIDQLAARFVLAITSGSGVNKFMENAVTDVAKLGDSIGNLGGIFGAVFRAVPGYAEILLTVGDAITKVLESAAQAAEPVIAVGLALHGFFIYGGAAVTISLALVASLVKVGAAFGKFNEAIILVGLNNLKKFGSAMVTAAANIGVYASGLLGVGRSAGVAAAGTRLLADAQGLLAKIPTTVWVLAAAAALASLVIAIIRSKDAAQKFNATLQETIQNAPLASVITTIQQAQAVTSARLAETTSKLNTAIRENTVVNAGRAGALNSNGTAIQNLDNASRHYQQGLGQLTDQQKLVTSRFGDLSKAYGGNVQALGLLNAAGITSAQITDTNKDKWAQALIQVDATAKAYAAMGTQAGVLGNDLDVLGRTVTDQAQAVKKLNDAWSQFIGDVTGTQTSFDTVAQGFFTLRDHSEKLVFSLGKLKVKYSDQKAAIDSLTPAGVALNQAFSDQVGNVDKLFASWRTAGLSANLFTAGVKSGIAPLVKYATGSQEATAQLVALAEEAGYQGPISLQALTKWLGNTHGATQRLKDITNTATEQEALLTGAMQAQGSFIANQLLGDINNAALNYFGVAKAVSAYGVAIARSGKGSDAANKAMKTAVAGIVQSEQAVGDNSSQMAAIVAKAFGISVPAAMKLVQAALGDLVGKLPPGQKKFELFAINGLRMTADEAGKLWKKFSESNLGALAGKADTTRDKFDKLASKGLGITTDQADKLWQHLRLQYLDTLGRKADTSKAKFEQMAKDGLGYSRDQADKLWTKLREQQLDAVGRRADTTKAKFEQLAAKLGISRTRADQLWTSLHTLTASGYSVNVKVNAQGYVNVNGFKISAGAYFSPHAEGGFISGGTPNRDSVPAMLMPGEVVVPVRDVQAGAVDHLRGRLPGFAAGGKISRPRTDIPGYAYGGKVGPGSKVGDTGDLTTNFPMQSFDAIGGFAKHSTATIAAAATKAFAAYVAAQIAAASGGGTGTAGDIVSYARGFLGKIPYKFGGTTLQGMDCSGFTGMVYKHFGYRNIPRTSEGQGSWVHATPTPQAGGLAFYHSPAGGPDPGHVAIIDRGARGIISQGGGLGPKLEGLHALPLLWTGIPPGGFHVAAPAGGKSGSAPGQAQAWMRAHLGDYGWGGGQWSPLLALWNQESGWRWNARNPSSGAYGIPQALPASKMGSIAADWRTNPVTQMRWGAEYIRGRYGNPATAEGHERAFNWYGQGGAVRGMAAGGPVGPRAAAYLKAWQTRRGGGFGAAWGPIGVNRQLELMQQAQHRAALLSRAPGLSAGQHKFWAKAAADEAKRAKVLTGERDIERTWRGQLGTSDTQLASLIKVAGSNKSLAKNVAGWKSQITRQKKTITAISKMLGYSNAQIAALEKAGKLGPGGKPLPPVTHTYGGDVGVFDSIAPVLAKALQPFRAGGMAAYARGGMLPVNSFDRGGMLPTGASIAWNGTGSPEPVGGGQCVTVTLEVAPGGNTAFEQLLHGMIRKYVRVRGGGSVQRAYSTPGSVSGASTWRSG